MSKRKFSTVFTRVVGIHLPICGGTEINIAMVLGYYSLFVKFAFIKHAPRITNYEFARMRRISCPFNCS